MTDCPDCGVRPGEAHLLACDVARCSVCGMQRIGCDHLSSDAVIWTGRWPGELEVEEGLAEDLNDLALKGMWGELRWSPMRQRWVQP